MNMKHLILIALLAFGATSAHARVLFSHSHPCPPPSGGTSVEIGYRDDWTDMQYLYVLGCDNTTCLYPLFGPFPKIGTATHWGGEPANWSQLVELARQNHTPGAYVGLWLIDSETGDTVRFRNPNNAIEYDQLQASWLSQQESSGKIMDLSNSTQEELTKSFTDALEGAYRRQKPTPERQMLQSLIDKYCSGHFAGSFPNNREEFNELNTVATYLAKTNQTLVVQQTPSPSNDQTIIVVPYVREFAGPVKVVDAGGKVMWEGTVDGATSIRMDYPSGTYFVQGDGKPLVVNIVR
jgi:hypothetical protein